MKLNTHYWAVITTDPNHPEHDSLIMGVYNSKKLAMWNSHAINLETDTNWSKVYKVKLELANPV